jgi:hypothetical protein
MRTTANIKALTGVGRPALQEWHQAVLATGSVLEGEKAYRSNLDAAVRTIQDKYKSHTGILAETYPRAAIPAMDTIGISTGRAPAASPRPPILAPYFDRYKVPEQPTTPEQQ